MFETRKCVVCGKEITREKSDFTRPPNRTTCSRRCAGSIPKSNLNRKWKYMGLGGGRWKLGSYIAVAKSTLSPEERKLVDADDLHYVLEHRLVMALHLGRPLEAYELARHLNGDKTDNRIENLALGTYEENMMDHVRLRNELALWKSIALTLFSMLGSEKRNNE